MDIRESLEKAVEVLRAGGVILYPTDTIWGIGCDACNADAVKKVFEIKRRSSAKSLVLLAADMDMVARHVRQIPPVAIDLVEVNDAPMTIIYPGGQYLAPEVLAEDGSVGIRIPLGDDLYCRQLVRRLRKPLVSTSANISGEPTAVGLQDVAREIVDGADFVVNPRFEGKPSRKASSIIAFGEGGEVKIIRE